MNKPTHSPAKKLALPSDPAAFKALDLRLGQEMARCARDYDDARTHLKAHHAKMSTQEAALVKQIAALQPSVDGLLDGTGPGLTKAVAKDCLAYLELNAKLHTTRQGKRLAYGATVPAGAQRLGGAIGDPSPGSVPGDLSEKSIRFSEKISTKGVQVAMLFKAIEGGNWDKGNPSYLSEKPGRVAAPKRPLFAEGLPRAAATAAMGAGMSHVSSEISSISTRDHAYKSQNPEHSVSHLSSSLAGQGYRPAGAQHIPGGGIKAKFIDKGDNTHTFHVSHSTAVPFAKPVKDASGPAPFKLPKMGLPKFKMSLPKSAPSGFKSPSVKPSPRPTPTAPVNNLDSQSLASGINGHLHNVVSRTTKPLFGKPQEQHAHLLSHAQPKNAIHDLRQQLAQGPGRTGSITEQRVPHADGGMGHLYSFEHHDEHGAKHVIHMMRSSPARRGGGGNAPSSAHKSTNTPAFTPPDRAGFEKDFIKSQAKAGKMSHTQGSLDRAYTAHVKQAKAAHAAGNPPAP